ncbi:MAG: hypothetical protein KJ984_01605 [Nanoarchaeota archaeon]|nr:hypothetical protein [Nanoarchaeota archaeon]
MRCLIMSNKKGLVLLISAMMLLSLLPLALAVDIEDAVAGAGVSKGTSDTFNETTSQTDAAQGGNVTELNLTSAASTTKWAGYYGQVTASLSLGIANAALFSFGDVANDQVKSVFATQNATLNFGNLVTGTSAGVDSVWSFTTTDVDSATLSHLNATTVSGISITEAAALNSYTDVGISTAGVYNSSILSDGSVGAKGNFAFGVAVTPNQRDFSNSTVIDYELVVPIGDGATLETYYFFMDIQ